MNTTLVILAAGMGSRFGGLKQVSPLGKHGEIIADFSVYDALQAGFNKVVYIIKKDMEELFNETVVSRVKRSGIQVEFAFQDINDLPNGLKTPSTREKPWGTSHALWAARNVINEPFMVINADDFYGRDVYKSIHSFLTSSTNGDYDYCMGGYLLENTVSSYGSVSRGVCRVESGLLVDIEEVLAIEKRHDGIGYTIDNNFKYLAGSTVVSMNTFGFKPSIFIEIEKGFTHFLTENLQSPKAEYFLPLTIKELLTANKATIKVLPALDTWYGFTYQQDKEIVQKAVWELIEQGKYPEKLF
ncbi:MAG: sugar phosphate nucleotidyltransferase [Defluviitaleaceae bacterium]|nr:sugar phosphate nucleotidyltransferase [Defluviitaleaceae bacterium]